MIIDIHAHVYAFPKIKSRLSGSAFMSAEEQIAVMNQKGIDKAVILPLNNPESPSEPQSIGEILYICEKYKGRFIPFCNVDPRLPGNKELIKAEDYDYRIEQYKQLGCRGLGELTCRIKWTDPSMLMLLRACEKYGLCVTFHTVLEQTNSYGVIDEMGLTGLEQVLKKFPKLKFLGHSGSFWSEISKDVRPEEKNTYVSTQVKPTGRLVKLMRSYPNLYGDLSANSGLNALQRDLPYAYDFIDEFQDRLLLGLDYCSITNDLNHIEWFREMKNNNKISKNIYEKIMWQNANIVLNLNL